MLWNVKGLSSKVARLRIVLLLAASSTLMLMFQNCGKAQKGEEACADCIPVEGPKVVGTATGENEPTVAPVIPTLRAADASVIEGMEAVIVFSLDQATTQDVDFLYTTAPGTALDNVDFVPKSGRVVIPAGELSSAVTIVTLNDGKVSSTKSMQVLVSEPRNLQIVDASSGDIEIADREEYGKSISIVASDATTKQGQAALVEIMLNQPSLQDVSVSYELTDDTAKAGTDYTDASGSITIKAGSRSAEISVATMKDNVYSGTDKKLKLTLSAPQNSVLGEKITGTITIQDGDAMPVLEVANVTNAKEGEKALLKLQLSGVSTRDVSFKAMTKDGTATKASDYAHLEGSFTIPAGMKDITIPVMTNPDSLGEGEEKFSIVLSGAQGATLDQTEVAVKILAGTAPVATLSGATVVEGANAGLMLRMTEAAKADVVINWHTVTSKGAGAASSADFKHASGITRLPKGAKDVAILVATVDDMLDEDTEKFWVRIDSISGADYRESQAEVSITDNDAEPDLSIEPVKVREGQKAVMVAQLSKVSGRPVTFKYSTADETAKGGEDYTAATDVTVTIPAGAIKAYIVIPTAADMTDEPAQTLLVKLSTATNAKLKTPAARLTIENSDPQLSIVGSSISEGGLMVFTLRLNFPSLENVEITLSTHDGSASAAAKDYTAISSKKIVLKPGAVRATVAVQTLSDNVRENDETLGLRVTALKGASAVSPRAVGVILSNIKK